MATTVQAIYDRFTFQLNDASHTRWTEAEFLQWLNAGQMEIVRQAPTANPEYAQINLVAGSRQGITGVSLAKAIRNVGGVGVFQFDEDTLSVSHPAWHTITATEAVTAWAFDPRDIRSFLVYPPNDGNGALEVLQGKYPAAIASVAGNIEIKDDYADALLNYCLYRAFSKDFESARSTERAATFFAAFRAVVAPAVAAEAGA